MKSALQLYHGITEQTPALWYPLPIVHQIFPVSCISFYRWASHHQTAEAGPLTVTLKLQMQLGSVLLRGEVWALKVVLQLLIRHSLPDCILYVCAVCSRAYYCTVRQFVYALSIHHHYMKYNMFSTISNESQAPGYLYLKAFQRLFKQNGCQRGMSELLCA